MCFGDFVVEMFGMFAEPTITKFPSDTNITEGEGVYFKFKVSGEPRPTVTWYHNGEPIKADYAREIEADGSLAIPSAELKHSGVYKAVAANQHGSEEREVKLTVNEEGITSTDAATMNGMVSSRPIPIPEFGKYVADLHTNSNQPFKDLYQVCVSVHVKNNYPSLLMIMSKQITVFLTTKFLLSVFSVYPTISIHHTCTACTGSGHWRGRTQY